jgi:hypothetical protein
MSHLPLLCNGPNKSAIPPNLQTTRLPNILNLVNCIVVTPTHCNRRRLPTTQCSAHPTMNSTRTYSQSFTNIAHLVVVNRRIGAIAHNNVHPVKFLPPRIKRLIKIRCRVINQRAYGIAGPDNPISQRPASTRTISVCRKIIRDADATPIRLVLDRGKIVDVAVAFSECDVDFVNEIPRIGFIDEGLVPVVLAVDEA